MSNSLVQITFHGLDHDAALETLIQHKAEKLRGLHVRLQKVRVVVDVPHRSQSKGNAFGIKLELLVPGEELVVSRESEVGTAHETAPGVVKEAFQAAQRLLLEHADLTSGAMRRHKANA